MGGTQSTTIANGFHKDIQARVTVNKALYKRALQEAGTNIAVDSGGQKIGLGGHAKTEFEYEHVQQLPGFVKIAPGQYLTFKMNGTDGQVFVSITARKKRIADNFPVDNGQSIIVDSKGYVQHTKPGKIWKDDQGRDHTVTQEEIDEKNKSNKAVVITSFKDFVEKRVMKLSES